MTWEDIFRHQSVIQELKKINKNDKSSILLYGPRGCGKSMLAEALAVELGVELVRIQGNDLLDLTVHECGAFVRSIFDKVHNTGCSVVLLEDLESIGASRRERDFVVIQTVLTIIQEEIDKNFPGTCLVFVASTNR